MDWDAIGALGEWAGAIAVVATLFYLARQIQQQNTNSAGATQERIIEGFNVNNTLLGSNPQLASLFKKGMYHPESLTDDEIFQWGWSFRAYINQYLKLYRMHQDGSVSDADWSLHGAQAADLLDTPGGRIFTESHADLAKHVFDAFQRASIEGGAWDITMGRGNEQSNVDV